MTKEDIIRKLTSRKFWLAVATLVSGLVMFFREDAKTAETVSGMVMSVAAVVAYICGEGLVDAENKTDDVYVAQEVVTAGSDPLNEEDEEED